MPLVTGLLDSTQKPNCTWPPATGSALTGVYGVSGSLV